MLIGLVLAPFCAAQDPADAPLLEELADELEPTENEAFDRFRHGTTDLQTLAEVLPLLAEPEKRIIIRSKLVEVDEPPRADLVALLNHPTLAVRLGSLELLEELAGADFSFNPWAPANSPDNTGAIARWQLWAGEPTERTPGSSVFSDDQRRSYLQDLLGEDRDKAARARQMLEVEGFAAVGFLENYLQETPTLSIGHRARIREAQYQITLSKHLGTQAATTARHLTFGSRDQLLSGLATLRSVGFLALPILRDFITHPDPLVRETAIDSLLVTGGEEAVKVVAPLLTKEPDVNVIHGALRRLKDIKGNPAIELAASFLSHPDEDLLVSAIQTCQSLAGESDPYSDQPSQAPATVHAGIIAALHDPRWRVRAVALEFIANRRVRAAKEACIAALSDSDEFVRFAAIRAIGAIRATEALPQLHEMLKADPSMAGAVIEGYAALNHPPEEEVLKLIDAAPVEARLAVLRAIGSNDHLAPIALRYAGSSDLDVACSALRHIAADTDLVKKPAYASVLVLALRSGIPEKVEAVMERLSMPSSESRHQNSGFNSAGNGDAEIEESGPTILDPLYDAFLLQELESAPAERDAMLSGTIVDLTHELVARTSPDSPAVDRFRASLNLMRAGMPQGFAALIRDLSALTTAQKIAIAESIYEPESAEALTLLGELLRDAVPEVRSAAATAAFSSEESLPFIQLVLNELTREGAVLSATEAYDYRAESVARRQRSNRWFRAWTTEIINAEEHPPELRVLALIFSREIRHTETLAAIKAATVSPNAHVRRAAWNALLTLRPSAASEVAEAISADPEAFVRAALARCFTGSNGNWSHRFSDSQIITDYHWNSSDSKPRASAETIAILERLATGDPAPTVRFEASLALLMLGAQIDLEDLVSLIPTLPKEAHGASRITRWLGENAKRVTPALRPLISIIDPAALRPSQLQEVTRRLGPTGEAAGFATFASLASGITTAGDSSQPFLESSEDEIPAVERNSLTVVYFYKPGCPECIRAKREIDALKSAFPLLELREYNLLEADSTLFNQALCDRFSVPSAQHTLSPAIFSQAGFLIRNDINPVALADLLSTTLRLAQDDSWTMLDQVEIAAAREEVDLRYQALTLPVILVAGLIDGINPCAFATIIFLLSYLQIARRTPREMLMVGIAFISAVFIAYLAAGLLLYEVLSALNNRFAGIQRWMNFGFASLALVAAALSFRDSYRARGGRLDEMTLQLPGFLKSRIRGVIRTGAKARHFVIAAFVAGLVISLLELACTGQVYAPIIFQIQQGRLDAIGWLATYNLAFIAPLVVIFLLAYGGLRSETLIAFQKRHTTSVKFALGVMFVVLAGAILFGPRLMGG
jgi:cytochrome c biogenesis protein CcdA/HEAT repeat protein